MISNFQIYINSAWTNFSPIYNNFKLIRERDADDILVIRTKCSGSINFYCEDFNNLESYVKTRVKLRCRFTENVCSYSKGHNGWLALDNKIDYYKKKISGEVTIIDVYYNLFNGVSTKNYVNIDTKIQALESYIFPKKCVNFENNKGITVDAYNLHNLISNYLTTHIGAGISYSAPPVIVDFFAVENYNYKKTEEFEITAYGQDIDKKPFNYSLREILTFLRDQLFIFWYADSVLRFIKGKDYIFTNGISLISYENNNSKIIEFDNENYSKIKYNTTDLKDVSNACNKYFTNKELNFLQPENIETSKKINAETNLQFQNDEVKGEGLLFFKAVQAGYASEENKYSNITKQFEIIAISGTQQYISGDWSNCNFHAYQPPQMMFQTKSFYLIEGEYLAITFNLAHTDSGVLNLNKIRFKLLYYTTALAPTPIYTHVPIIGSNQISYSALQPTGWYTVRVYVDSWAQNFRITNFEIKNGSGYCYKIQNTDVGGFKVPNYELSLYRNLTFDTVEMPYAKALMTGGIEEPILCRTKRNFTQVIKYDLQNLIESINFGQLMQTSQGWLRVDKVEVSHTNNSNSYAEITLKGK